jgi:hypothetical protein
MREEIDDFNDCMLFKRCVWLLPYFFVTSTTTAMQMEILPDANDNNYIVLRHNDANIYSLQGTSMDDQPRCSYMMQVKRNSNMRYQRLPTKATIKSRYTAV